MLISIWLLAPSIRIYAGSNSLTACHFIWLFTYWNVGITRADCMDWHDILRMPSQWKANNVYGDFIFKITTIISSRYYYHCYNLKLFRIILFRYNNIIIIYIANNISSPITWYKKKNRFLFYRYLYFYKVNFATTFRRVFCSRILLIFLPSA